MKEFGLIRNSKAEGLQSSILRALEETKAIQYRDVEDGGDEIFEVCSLVFWFGLKFFFWFQIAPASPKKSPTKETTFPVEELSEEFHTPPSSVQGSSRSLTAAAENAQIFKEPMQPPVRKSRTSSEPRIPQEIQRSQLAAEAPPSIRIPSSASVL